MRNIILMAFMVLLFGGCGSQKTVVLESFEVGLNKDLNISDSPVRFEVVSNEHGFSTSQYIIGVIVPKTLTSEQAKIDTIDNLIKNYYPVGKTEIVQVRLVSIKEEYPRELKEVWVVKNNDELKAYTIIFSDSLRGGSDIVIRANASVNEQMLKIEKDKPIIID